MDNELIDVTEAATKYKIPLPGWRVVVTRRVWDQWIGTPIGANDPRAGSRLETMLGYLSAGLKRVVTLNAGFFPGFGCVGQAANGTCESGEHCLSAFAMFWCDGSPCMFVMTSEEMPRDVAVSTAANVH